MIFALWSALPPQSLGCDLMIEASQVAIFRVNKRPSGRLVGGGPMFAYMQVRILPPDVGLGSNLPKVEASKNRTSCLSK